jgi:heme-degrading monooxygenase HmoA
MSWIEEFATFTVDEGREEEFEAAMMKARRVVAQADGFVSIQLSQSIERPQVFVAILKWRSVEAHTEGFRGSDLFTQWRGILGPFFAADPQVEHFTPRLQPFRG